MNSTQGAPTGTPPRTGRGARASLVLASTALAFGTMAAASADAGGDTTPVLAPIPAVPAPAATADAPKQSYASGLIVNYTNGTLAICMDPPAVAATAALARVPLV